MKILITGANGQLGKELQDCFKDKYHKLGQLDILTENNELFYYDLQELDITNLIKVKELFLKEKFDLVINCSAFTNVDLCETEKLLAFKVNSIGPRNLAIACDLIGAKLVHISTDYVFSGNDDIALSEFDIPNPISIYGKTKLLGEKYIQQFCKKYFILRTAWLYGKHQKNFVKTIIKNAILKKSLKVVSDQFGSPTSAYELCYHILKLAKTEEYGLYHATNEERCSWFDFATEIVKLSEIDAVVAPCATEDYPTVAVRPKSSYLENLMLKSINLNCFSSWKVALKNFITENLDNIKGEL